MRTGGGGRRARRRGAAAAASGLPPKDHCTARRSDSGEEGRGPRSVEDYHGGAGGRRRQNFKCRTQTGHLITQAKSGMHTLNTYTELKKRNFFRRRKQSRAQQSKTAGAKQGMKQGDEQLGGGAYTKACFSSSLRTSSWLLSLATSMGVFPSRFCSVTAAPLSSRRATQSLRP